MKLIKIFVLLTGLLFLTLPAGATNGMKIVGIGQIQRAMGGANIALPLDAACTITNPASLKAAGKRIDLGTTYFSPDVQYRATGAPGYITQDSARIESRTDGILIPTLGAILPINQSLTFGLGLYGISGMGIDYPSNLYNNVTLSEYGFVKLAPAISYTLPSGLSFGFSPNFDYAFMSFLAGSIAELPHYDSTSYGLGFTLGLHYPLSDFLAVGLAYESKQIFQDFEFDTIRGKDKLNFDQPQNIAAGIAYMPSSYLRFALDIVWINWSQSNGTNQPNYTQNSSNATPWNMDWNNQVVYKFGLEYGYNDQISLRAGYNYGKTPLNTTRAFENLAFPAVTENHYTVGAGFKMTRSWQLNLGVMYSPESDFPTANLNQGITAAETTMSQYSIDVGFSYIF